MLSTLFTRPVRTLSGLQWHLRASYATALNVKPQSVDSKSFIETLDADWAQANPFEQLPGLTRWQLMRGFMKGGRFADASINDVMNTCRQSYGDIFVLPGVFNRNKSVVLYNIDDFEKVHRTEGPYPVRPGTEHLVYYRETRKDGFFDDMMGLLGNGEDWGKFRHAVNPVLMQPRNAKLYMDPMQNVNKEFLQRIREIRDPHTLEVPDNFIDVINRFTFESVAIVALDKPLGLLKNSDNQQETELLFQSIQLFIKSIFDLGMAPPFYKYISTPAYRRFKKAMDTVFDITYKYTNEALSRIEQEQKQLGAVREERSVLEKLLKIDKKIAMIMAMDMMTGGAHWEKTGDASVFACFFPMCGVDTTSSVLSGIILSIALNPEKQQKLREELLRVLPRKEDPFTVENMQNLPYLRACIKESMRLYPLLFGNLRETGADLALSGYRVPKGTMVMLASNLLLCEEKYYPRAKEFLPERWLRDGDRTADGEKLVAKNLSPFIFLPFGFGPRSCAGKRIVDMELEMALANLVRNFKIEFNYPAERPFKVHYISAPRIPLKFKFTDLNY